MSTADGSLKNILTQLIEKLGTDSQPVRIKSAWQKIAGSVFADFTEPVSFTGGRLVIAVSDSTRLYELSLRKNDLRESINAALGKKVIKEIRFKIGTIHKRGEI